VSAAVPQRVTILLVGRDPADAEPLREAFRAALGPDLVFQTARDLDAARALLGGTAVDVVIVDLSTRRTVPETVAAVVAAAGDASVIALADHDQSAAAVQAMHDGAQDYLLTSTLTPAVVEMTLRYAAERARTLRDLRQSEETAHRALSLLAATLEATADGILVVSLDGRITAHNRRFAEMWRVPEAALASRDLDAVRSHMLQQMRQPDATLAHLREGAAHPELESHDVLELRDGRIIERHAQPQRVADRVVGRVLSYRDVTQSRIAAAALQREHDLLTTIIESTGEALFAKDLQGRYLLMNSFAADVLGLDRGAVLGRRDDELFPPDQARAFQEADRRVMETGTAIALEEVHDRPEGTRYMLVRKGALRDRTGRIIGVLGVARDVTERHRAERAVRDSEERYRAFIAQSTEGVWRVEVPVPVPIDVPEDEMLNAMFTEAFVAECNDALARMYGSPAAAEVVGAPLEQILPRDAQNEAFLRAFVRGGFRLTDAEIRVPDRSGAVHVFVCSVVGVVDRGRFVRAWGTQRDVTERRRAELIQAATYQISEAANTAETLDQLLPEIHRSVGRLIAAENFYVALLSEDGTHLTFPYHVDEVDADFEPRPLGKGLTDYVLRSQQPLLATPEEWERLLERGEVELIGAASIDWLGVPLTTGGRAIGVLAVQSYRETTRYDDNAKRILMFVADQVANAIERQRSAAALRTAEERYRAFVLQSTEGVSRIEYDPPVPVDGRPVVAVVADMHAAGRVAECNDAMARMYGGERASELVGWRLSQLFDPSFAANELLMMEFVRNGFRLVDGESHGRDRDGRIRVLYHNAVGFVEDGRLVRVWGTHRDVTERRVLEEQLRQAQKMEAVGRLAGGIAHDFNNILTAILGTSDLMLGDLPADHPTRADVLEVRKAALRAAELTRQLLAYSRRQVLAPQHIDLNAVVAALEPMLRRLIGEDVQFETALAEDSPAVQADPNQIEQVVLNLAVNARDAMPNGGRLRIETRAITFAAGDTGPAAVPPGEYVELAVIDTGTGMSDEVRVHLFEPFFTTKEVGKGTGLGLATVYGIVQQSGGHIAVDTAPERGTAMRIYFPRATAQPADEPVEIAAPQPRVPVGQTILLVEDEDAVRAFAQRALEGAGYRVVTAANGIAATAIAESRGAPVDLLLTDIVMPGMSGGELAERLGERWPGLAVLYVSGYVGDGDLPAEAADALLPKPFDAETLLRRVRQAIDAQQSPTFR